LHCGEQSKRIIWWRSDFSKALNEGFLLGDALFLLGHMPDRHLLFCLTCPHGVLTMMASTHDLLKIGTLSWKPRKISGGQKRRIMGKLVTVVMSDHMQSSLRFY
jgi:hypothetical protein